MFRPKDDANGQERRHGGNRRGGHAGKSETGRHPVGSRATGMLRLRVFLAELIACHSGHIAAQRGHRHGAHAYRHRDRKSHDEDKKHADDRFRHREKGSAGVKSFQAASRKSREERPAVRCRHEYRAEPIGRSNQPFHRDIEILLIHLR